MLPTLEFTFSQKLCFAQIFDILSFRLLQLNLSHHHNPGESCNIQGSIFKRMTHYFNKVMPTFVITSHFPQCFSTFSRGTHGKSKNANLNKNRVINTFVFLNYLIWQYLYPNVRVLQYYTPHLHKLKTIGIFENFIINRTL